MRTRLTAMALILLSGCGVSMPDSPSTAGPEDVPYELLDETRSTSTTLPELIASPVTIWLVGADQIVPVAREVVGRPRVERSLALLREGPTDSEALLGLRSAVTGDAVVDSVVSSGVARVSLSAAFAASPPREQLLGLAQIVYTITEVPGTEVVTFELDGQAIDVPRSDGSVSDGPVTRRDYASLTPG